MKYFTKTRIVGVLLAASLAGGLAGCAKQDEDVAPTAKLSVATSDIRVVDGRLVFKDYQSFTKALDELKNRPEAELTAWEKARGFSSLRRSDEAAASSLREEFGFPQQWATLINARGEYQIGNQYFWYHAGEKHEFNFLADMQAVQRGQSVAHFASAAGRTPVSSSSTASRTTMETNSGRDGKYQYDFCMWGNCGSRRKIVYETYAYADYNSSAQGYFTTLLLDVKLEFRNSKGQWRVAGETRDVNVAISGDAFAYTDYGYCQTSYSAPIYVNYSSQSNSNSSLTLSQGFVSSCGAPARVYWNFSVNGSINSWITSDPGNAFPISGTDLW
ncbi:hypothetical protein EJV47_02540 [Hymenobacter gummosus]|uniref:Lipoprotein n=1 Tax=Hymenobacter gummosus TaxID=1776032 RepID=A0A431U8M1_9BACT|nr:hypothetical protein [Hymenobacter gummosus]RTQ53634.1 hypothetical protein EJV47_02540 [Hymenobacter gummosus]